MPAECAIFHSNRYHAGEACEHCAGVIRHESWCLTRSALVRYAYEIVFDSNILTLADRLILHALGVNWSPCDCKNKCAI